MAFLMKFLQTRQNCSILWGTGYVVELQGRKSMFFYLSLSFVGFLVYRAPLCLDNKQEKRVTLPVRLFPGIGTKILFASGMEPGPPLYYSPYCSRLQRRSGSMA